MTMFLSKIQNASRLYQLFPRVSYTEGFPGLFSCRTFSDNVLSTDKAVPDKLYSKIEIEVRGNDPAVLKSYGTFSEMAAKHLGITMSRNFTPRKPVHERLTVLKSVHIYKKHRVQYETRTYFRFMDFLKLTGSTADTFLEYLQRNLPEGVAMKVTKVEIQRLPEAVSTPPS
ncbi:28S ribosomal protein S10, mitochondrial [Cephus cinctus]|uniref:Small ribosomal subunit protein uS10m n=1 Tax=Cephus cinctus TaxID=211228 RepID=A0AAJ7BMK3_CEPCN|nr:28S ribosomal protein S10, mitochondrial [Cephus cinctus]